MDFVDTLIWPAMAAGVDMSKRKEVGSVRRTYEYMKANQRRHDVRLMCRLLNVARRRRPRGTIIHSDQGCQYGSDDWRRFCRTNRLEPSMSMRGNCWDNAVAESFFGSLKKELIKKHLVRQLTFCMSRINSTLCSAADNLTVHLG